MGWPTVNRTTPSGGGDRNAAKPRPTFPMFEFIDGTILAPWVVHAYWACAMNNATNMTTGHQRNHHLGHLQSRLLRFHHPNPRHRLQILHTPSS